jgi:hypothetical protein
MDRGHHDLGAADRWEEAGAVTHVAGHDLDTLAVEMGGPRGGRE